MNTEHAMHANKQTTADIQQKYKQLIMSTYKSFPIVLQKGTGMYVTDLDGKRYLDFVGGIAVNTLGHGHPRLVKALSSQIEKMIHCSNLYIIPQQVLLAEKLLTSSSNICQTTNDFQTTKHSQPPQPTYFSKAFFCNSGTEAIESALKLARKYGKSQKNECYKIIAMENSFHGRTMGALSATGQKKYQIPFMPLINGIDFVPYNNASALEEAIDSEVCAILIEPIQGEGGINSAETTYLRKVRELCDKHNILLIFDEVQCGLGRTGTLFAFEQYDIIPDIICLAKGLGGGFPIGAILVNTKADCFEPGDHAATFGGNPAACTAALVVLEELTDNNLLQNVKTQGMHLQKGLQELKIEFPVITDIRGRGLMQGINLACDTKKIITACMEKGLLLVGAGDSVIRFVPPLIVAKEDIDQALAILRDILAQQTL